MQDDVVMSETAYFHGYSDVEHNRLIRQAEYWRDCLIPVGLDYQPGDRVLEIGCAVGATLAVLSDHFPGIHIAGVDVQSRQIDAAKQHLASRNNAADLQVADGSSLPHKSESFDHVFIMWMVEHLKDAEPVLQEALRVLRPGGTIAVTETDYASFKVTPESVEWDYVEKAQYRFFAQFGNAIAGRQLGPLLCHVGFIQVQNQPVGFHFFRGGNGLDEHIRYVTEFLEPGIGQMVRIGFDETRIRRGLDCLRRVPDQVDGSFTQIIYRAHGVKPES